MTNPVLEGLAMARHSGSGVQSRPWWTWSVRRSKRCGNGRFRTRSTSRSDRIMTASGSSSVQQARQVLADRLRELCKDADLDGKDLAAACGWHPSKVSRISTAKTAPSADDIRAWCRACGAEDQTADLIASLRVVEGMWVSWRRMERAGLRRAQEARLPLYERTRWLRAYSRAWCPV